MEEVPGTCDFYAHRWVCCHLAGEHSSEPERSVREAINSVLPGCARATTLGRPCFALDLGANAGWFSALMLSYGATVLSVEPQQDFAAGLNATAQLNCWSERSAVLHAFAYGTREEKQAYRPRTGSSGWRLMGSSNATQFRMFHRARPSAVDFDDLLQHELWRRHLHGREPPTTRPLHLDLIKLDGDGPENSWLQAVLTALRAGSLSLGAAIVEVNGVKPATMRAFQELNFSIFRLDAMDGRRFITSRGWDAFSAPGTIERLDRLRHLRRDDLEQEMFGVRAMRHVFRVRDALSLEQWGVLLETINGYSLQFLISSDGRMVEASNEDLAIESMQSHRLKLKSPERNAAMHNLSFRPRYDGLD